MTSPNDPRALVARLAGLVAMEAKSPEVIEMAGAIAAAAREPSAAAPSPAPSPAADVETVRRALHDAVYCEDGCDGRFADGARAALARLSARIAEQDETIRQWRREVERRDEMLGADDARLAGFERLAERAAHLDADDAHAILESLAALRREGR